MQLVFKKRLQPTSPSELSSVEQQQLRLAIERWNGEEHEDLGAFLAGDEGYCELYEILHDGKRAYDAWVFPTDDASFFVTGEAEFLPFHIVQGGVEATQEGGKVEIKDALQQGYDGILTASS